MRQTGLYILPTEYICVFHIVLTVNSINWLVGNARANYTDRAIATCRRKLVSTFADRVCHVVNVTDSYGCILGFLDRSRYFFSKYYTRENKTTC
jgi:hypothetical protein